MGDPDQIALRAQLLDEVDEAVILLDLATEPGVVIYWSGGAQRLYGYTAEEAVGRTLLELVIVEQSLTTAMAHRDPVMRGETVVDELQLRDKHGRVFPAGVRLRKVSPTAAKASECVIAVSVDISARREAEAAARRHAEAQQEIVDLGRAALGEGCTQALLEQAVGAATRVLSGDCGALVEHVPESEDLIVTAGVGWGPDPVGERMASEKPSVLEKVLGTDGLAVIDDWEAEQRFTASSMLKRRGVRSTVAVLVGDPHAPFGVLSVHYTHAGAVPEDCAPFLDALANVLADAMHSRDVQERMRHLALHDELTDLPNRTLFLDRVAHALLRTDRDPRRSAVFVVDLDHFKLVNDGLGHEAGDELLRKVAPRLAGAIRRQDTLARLGGDEFAVLCEQILSEDAATRIAGKMAGALEEPIGLGGDEHVVSASIGIALSSPGSCAADLLRDADAAMFQAKLAGRGGFEVFDREMHERVLGRVRTESALRTALAGEEIHLHYQPLISLQNGQIVGAEALARWRHAEWGPVSPAEFIAVAEESGLIHSLGAQMLRRAGRECVGWHEHPGFAGVAVNVSTRQLLQPEEVARVVREVIAAEGLQPQFLTIEITESVLIEQLEAARNALETLSDLGVRLSLDDFGTGYSSLSYLANLNFQSVKIDRVLIEKIVSSPKADALAAAIIRMGHALGQQVIAEGVETLEQATRLRELDCDVAQGFYFAMPVAPEAFTSLLHGGPPSWAHLFAEPGEPVPGESRSGRIPSSV
ncbi:MAG: putative signaling protein [Solirubrobacterales bacterium]|nr:putative signaling protein [Solirubrobacterales bacterium]